MTLNYKQQSPSTHNKRLLGQGGLAHTLPQLSDPPSMQHSQKHPANQRSISRQEEAGLCTRNAPSEQSRSWGRYGAGPLIALALSLAQSEPFIKESRVSSMKPGKWNVYLSAAASRSYIAIKDTYMQINYWKRTRRTRSLAFGSGDVWAGGRCLNFGHVKTSPLKVAK